MGKYIYIHYTNLLIEARRLSAFRMERITSLKDDNEVDTFDNSYWLDLRRLHEFLTDGGYAQVKRIALFGSNPAKLETWGAARKHGFETMVEEDLSKAPQQHKVDVRITATIIKDACAKIDPAKDQIVLVAGDSDFAPTVELLKEDGFEVQVIFWGHASYQLRTAATIFSPLDEHLEFFRYRRRKRRP